MERIVDQLSPKRNVIKLTLPGYPGVVKIKAGYKIALTTQITP
jgi:hypothetical protein